MFYSWLDGIIFGIIGTFFTGIIACVVAKYDLKNYKA